MPMVIRSGRLLPVVASRLRGAAIHGLHGPRLRPLDGRAAALPATTGADRAQSGQGKDQSKERLV